MQKLSMGKVVFLTTALFSMIDAQGHYIYFILSTATSNKSSSKIPLQSQNQKKQRNNPIKKENHRKKIAKIC